MSTTWRLFNYSRWRLRSSHFNPIAIRGRIAEHWELLGTVQSSAISPAAIEQRKTTEWWTRNFRGLFSKLRDELLPLSVIIKQLKTVAEHSNRNLMADAQGFLEGLHQTLVANCAVNAFLSSTAIALNVITIQALRKTRLLSKTLKTLLLSLVVSDLGVGLLVQPLYIAILVMIIDQSTLFWWSVQYISYIFGLLGYVFSSASFLGIFALTVDRFLAIHLHLRYQEVVTYKRIVALVISIWVLSSALSLLTLKGNLEKVLSSVIGIIGSVCLIIAGTLCCKMHAVVRRHRREINCALKVQQLAQNGKLASDARMKKTALATFYMYIVFLGCYVPYFSVRAAFRIPGESVLRWHLSHYFLTLVFLNSSLNPLVYCWKMRNIRRAVMSVLRNIFQKLINNSWAQQPITSAKVRHVLVF